MNRYKRNNLKILMIALTVFIGVMDRAFSIEHCLPVGSYSETGTTVCKDNVTKRCELYWEVFGELESEELDNCKLYDDTLGNIAFNLDATLKTIGEK